MAGLFLNIRPCKIALVCRWMMAFSFLALPSLVLCQSIPDCITAVARDGKQGFVDGQGQLLFPMQPYDLYYPQDGLIVVHVDKGYINPRKDPNRFNPYYTEGKTGLLNLEGEWIVPLDTHPIGCWGQGMRWVCTGGSVRQNCTEPEHVHGGLYALFNSKGLVVDSLQDIALAPEEGISLLFRDGKIALMDSSGKMRSDFAFDRAIHWFLSAEERAPGMPDKRSWKTAVRRDGKWFSYQDDGRLELLDWPAEFDGGWTIDDWRRRPAAWFTFYRFPGVIYEGLSGKPKYHTFAPKDASFANCFYDEAAKYSAYSRLRDDDLAKLGLQIITQNGLSALAQADGKSLTSYGHYAFEATAGGFVRQWDTIAPASADTIRPEPTGEDEFGAGGPSANVKEALLNAEGVVVIPFGYYVSIKVYPEARFLEVEHIQRTETFDFKGKKIKPKPVPKESPASKTIHSVDRNGKTKIVEEQGDILAETNFPVDELQIIDGYVWYRNIGTGQFFAKKIGGVGNFGPFPSMQTATATLARLQKRVDEHCPDCALQTQLPRFWLVARGDSLGLCDTTGQLVLPVIYGRIIPQDDWIFVKRGEFGGAIDLQGQLFIPIAYKYVDKNACGHFTLTKTINGRDHMGIRDRAGHWIWEMGPK